MNSDNPYGEYSLENDTEYAFYERMNDFPPSQAEVNYERYHGELEGLSDYDEDDAPVACEGCGETFPNSALYGKGFCHECEFGDEPEASVYEAVEVINRDDIPF